LSVLLPLFPLDLVLLPGVPLPLHIFEPRYKEMITQCLDRNEVFGIVRAKDGGMAQVGCTAEIVTVTKKSHATIASAWFSGRNATGNRSWSWRPNK